MIRLPKAPYCITSPLIFKLLFFYYNVIPAIIADAVISFRSSKQMAVKITRDVYRLFQVFKNYNTEFTFDNQNMKTIHENMSSADHLSFPCILPPEDFQKYVKNTVKGIRVYYLKETGDDLKQAKKKLFLLFLIDWFLDFCFISCGLYFAFINVCDNLTAAQSLH